MSSVARLAEELAKAAAGLLLDLIDGLNVRIAGLDRDIRARAGERDDMRRPMTVPGIGPVCAMAEHAFAPPVESFRCGRDFAARFGLTPRQRSTAGRRRLGRITKMGQRDIRNLLVLGATSVLRHRETRVCRMDVLGTGGPR